MAEKTEVTVKTNGSTPQKFDPFEQFAQLERNLAVNPAAAIHVESGDEAVIAEGKVDDVSNHSCAGNGSDRSIGASSFWAPPGLRGQLHWPSRLASPREG